jgi:hypothetical protein
MRETSSPQRGPSRFPCIELGIGLDAFPVFGSFIAPTLYFVAFVVYFMEGRWAGYIPTVSETGSEYPNSRLMELVFMTVAVSIFFSGYCLFWYVVTFYRTNLFIRLLLTFGVVSGSLGFLLLTVFPVNIDPPTHFFASFVGLGGVIFFQLIFWFVVYPNQGWISRILRFLLVAGQIVALGTCASVELVVGHRPSVTTAALGEYVFLVLVPIFLTSFSGDLAGIDEYVIDLGD